MKSIKWKYLNSPTSQEEINETEIFLKIQFPDDYKSFLVKHNGARPVPNAIKLQSGREVVFERLIRIENCEPESVSVYAESLREGGNHELIPFGIDPYGNFFCFDFSKKSKDIVFWDHESNGSTWICGTFSEMLKLLKRAN